jgi:hypothetical protein
MSGFGTGPYGLASLGLPADEPETLAPAKIGNARKIDGKTRRYVVAADGGFEAMDETAQRVLLLVSLAVGKEPPFLTPQGNAEMEQRIRTALAPLLDTRDPDIDLEEVDCSTGPDNVARRYVRYRNLRTGTRQYVTPR